MSEIHIPITGDRSPKAHGPRDVLIPISGTVTPDRDSERAVTPQHANSTPVHTESCRPLVGENYPPRWCSCEESAWQQLVDDVGNDETDNALIEHRDALAHFQNLIDPEVVPGE